MQANSLFWSLDFIFIGIQMTLMAFEKGDNAQSLRFSASSPLLSSQFTPFSFLSTFVSLH